jgi:RNA polymerase sigma-70 factor, ECF subfamily
MNADGMSSRGVQGEEAALVASLRAGDESAYEALVRTYGGRLMSVARRMLRNEEDARDVVQAAYLSAFRSMDGFEGTCQLSTWLHRIVVNTALMRMRTRRRKPEESIDALLPAFKDDGHHVAEFADWSAQPDDLLQQDETRAFVRSCVAELPDNYRVVLLLRDIEEMSTQEVADALGMTAAAVKIRLHRARQALATLVRTRFEPSVTTRATVQPKVGGIPSRQPGTARNATL